MTSLGTGIINSWSEFSPENWSPGHLSCVLLFGCVKDGNIQDLEHLVKFELFKFKLSMNYFFKIYKCKMKPNILYCTGISGFLRGEEDKAFFVYFPLVVQTLLCQGQIVAKIGILLFRDKIPKAHLNYMSIYSRLHTKYFNLWNVMIIDVYWLVIHPSAKCTYRELWSF